MPLTSFQKELGKLLACNRSEESYLAGGAAILASPNSKRYSQDLDFFHDSSARVARAFEADKKLLEEHGYGIEMEINQPGYLKVIVSRQKVTTKIEWAQDSTWRFMPVMKSDDFGYQLHPIDSATNKVLALAGREEVRDLLDTIYLHRNVLDLGPLVWAAVGKDPGFSPLSLIELLKRRGKVRPEELDGLHLVEKIDIRQLKMEWREALSAAEEFTVSRPPDEIGCLYYSVQLKQFINPNETHTGKVVPHFGRPGGVLPKIVEDEP